ncbi:MAG: hypothetical protein Q4P25_05995, partial [Tissierellia bacterium]|nr:hypothetical protein [Tissierellia bacterium]
MRKNVFLIGLLTLFLLLMPIDIRAENMVNFEENSMVIETDSSDGMDEVMTYDMREQEDGEEFYGAKEVLEESSEVEGDKISDDDEIEEVDNNLSTDAVKMSDSPITKGEDLIIKENPKIRQDDKVEFYDEKEASLEDDSVVEMEKMETPGLDHVDSEEKNPNKDDLNREKSMDEPEDSETEELLKDFNDNSEEPPKSQGYQLTPFHDSFLLEQSENKKSQKDESTVELVEFERGNGLALRRGLSEISVSNFDELKRAIDNAPDDETVVILITNSFEMKDTIEIGENKKIILVTNNKQKADEDWVPIEQPADYKSQGEKKQREIIEEARKRGEEGIKKADKDLELSPRDIVIRRSQSIISKAFFDVFGDLQLGLEDHSLILDGNQWEGSFFNVYKKLTMKNAILTNSNGTKFDNAPVIIKDGGEFTMDGGRITKNKGYVGAISVDPGGTFHMNNGLIDNNEAVGNYGGGGIFAGTVEQNKDPNKKNAVVNIKGGIIAKNKSQNVGGGISSWMKSVINIDDGIIGGNESTENGAGISISDQFIKSFSNTVNGEFANTYGDYDEYVKLNKAEAKFNGGLIIKNQSSGNGGGLYIDTNHVNLNKTMILDNESPNFGGGLYVSFPPRIQIIENLLITENEAKMTVFDQFGGGNGGGLWNCPTGYVHIGDGHSVYIYNNNADGYGKDITFSKKTEDFKLNGNNIGGKFYSHISPVTKEKSIIKFLEEGKTNSEIPNNM